jgi:hypothetical protein
VAAVVRVRRVVIVPKRRLPAVILGVQDERRLTVCGKPGMLSLDPVSSRAITGGRRAGRQGGLACIFV